MTACTQKAGTRNSNPGDAQERAFEMHMVGSERGITELYFVEFCLVFSINLMRFEKRIGCHAAA
jgi:hypothetical protein